MGRPEQLARRVTLASIATSAVLAVIKIAVGLEAGSVAVVSDGLESAADVFASSLVLVGLWESRERTAKTLAHGEQRALEIGMALASRPRLLLLDEPTAGMSPEETRTMMDLIVKLASERTVILVEHKMKLVLGISDRILVLHHGELLAQGTPQEVRQNEAVKRVYLGQREH